MEKLFFKGELTPETAKKVFAGEFYGDVKTVAVNWAAKRLVAGEKLPLPVSEIASYGEWSFIESVVKNFQAQEAVDWDKFWDYANAYKPEELLWLPRIIFGTAGWISDKHPEQLQKLKEWTLAKHLNRDDFASLLLVAAEDAPFMLEYFKEVLNEFHNIHEDFETRLVINLGKIWENNPDMQQLVLDIYGQIVGLRMSDKVIDLIITQLNKACTRLQKSAEQEAKNLHVDNSQGKKAFFDKAYQEQKVIGDFAYKILKSVRKQGRYDQQNWNKEIPKLILQNSFLLPETRIRMMKLVMGPERTNEGFKSGFDFDNLDLVKKIITETGRFEEGLAVETFKFYRKAYDLCPEYAPEIYNSINNLLIYIVKKNGYEKSRFEWLPGLSYDRYPEGLKQLTDLSIDIAAEIFIFYPQSLLTALNVCLFSDKKEFDVDLLMRRVKKIFSTKPEQFSSYYHMVSNMLIIYQDYLETVLKLEGQLFVADVARMYIDLLFEKYIIQEAELKVIKPVAERFGIELYELIESSKAKFDVLQKEHEKVDAAREKLLAYFKK